MKRSTIALLLSSTIALAACGESQEDKARTKVCDARADISKQVDQLQGFTLATATVDGVSANLKAIRDDVGEIADAQADLNDDRRAQVQAANKAFSAQVTSIAQNVGKSLSVADAETQIKASLTQLADSYKQTLGRIDCG